MQAKDAARVQNKWLLVNLQSTREFSSHMVELSDLLIRFMPQPSLTFFFIVCLYLHLVGVFMQLNRDTWANEAVAQTIKTNFIFWQVRFVFLSLLYFLSFEFVFIEVLGC